MIHPQRYDRKSSSICKSVRNPRKFYLLASPFLTLYLFYTLVLSFVGLPFNFRCDYHLNPRIQRPDDLVIDINIQRPCPAVEGRFELGLDEVVNPVLHRRCALLWLCPYHGSWQGTVAGVCHGLSFLGNSYLQRFFKRTGL